MAKKKTGARPRHTTTALPPSAPAVLPLGALMLAASMGSWAQAGAPAVAASPAESRSLAPVTVREQAEAPQGKDSVRATTTTIGKGNQQLRDIPQSVTVVTEKMVDDRNLDTEKDVQRNTAGITILATRRSMTAIRSTTTASRCCAAPRPCCSAAAPPAAPSTRSARCRA